MASEVRQVSASVRLPGLRGAVILTGGCEDLTILAEGEIGDGTPVAVEGGDLLARMSVPQPATVTSDCRHHLAVRTEDNSLDCALVTRESGYVLSGMGVP
jgi:hypothetical protein